MYETLLDQITTNLSLFLAAVSVALFGVYVYDWSTPFSAREELAERDNPAVGVHLAGYVFALMVLLTGASRGAGGSSAHPVDVALYGVLGIALLRLGAVVADRLILRGFSVWTEITEDRNLGTAFVTAGAAIGTGLVLAGALTGDSASLATGMLTTLEYFLLSQAVLVAAALVYLALVRYRHADGTVLGVLDELRDRDNAAVGLAFAGYLVGVSLVVSASIDGNDIAGWRDLGAVLATLGLSSALGVGSMLAVRPFVDRAVVPYATVNTEIGEQGNLALGGLSAAFYVGFGLLLYGITG